MVAQQTDPWSMMSEVWEGEKIAKELSKGRVYHWKAEPTRQWSRFVEQSPRVLEW